MESVGSERAALFGVSEGGAMSARFAATYPARTAALILHGSFARTGSYLMTQGEIDARLQAIESEWPDSVDPAVPAPSLAADDNNRRWWQTYMRQSASPGAAIALLRMNSQIDVRDVLPTICVRTLIPLPPRARFGHGAAAWRQVGADVITPTSEARFLAAHVPGARLVELPGIDHLPWAGDQDSLLGEVEEFLTGVRRGPEPDRVLATILLPTSRARRRSRPGSEIAAGETSSNCITRSSGANSSGSAAASWTRRVTPFRVCCTFRG